VLIAVPSEAPGGLDARIADHFGHSDAFTLVQVDGDQLGQVTVLPNAAHQQGGCMGPVMLLKENGVDALVSGGMGGRPLAGFRQVGITVYFKEGATTVREAIDLVAAGSCRQFGDQDTCAGHSDQGGCSGHHHEDEKPPKLEPVDGPAEPGRLVQLAYELSAEGQVIDRSEDVRYLHGQNQLLPSLERAVAGRRAGESFELTLAPADGYGERDEARVVEVPRSQIPPDATPGAILRMERPDGAAMPVAVVSVGESTVTLDANHPLAGKTVTFKVKVLGVARLVEE
jgi:FKBP-type peptidyl-prolyl cis-trans isomerase 2/predicted Fe-Mo cluster-binding NifX family protein